MPSLYLHIPFCHNKCYFCSFVVSIGQAQRVDAYLDALDKEMALCPPGKLKTAYVGGGTPSYLGERQLEKLMKTIRRYSTLEDGAEITLECNPESINLDKARSLRAMGVNRISLGLQSFDDKQLSFLGRPHDSAAGRMAFACLRTAGFDNINVDLMFAFPGQTNAQLRKDIQQITALGSEHISVYALTVEEESRFFARGVRPQNMRRQEDQYFLVMEGLAKKGYRQYEVSNFCRPGYESRHNLMCWEGQNYLGVGVGAHSHRDGHRWWNIRKITEYIRRMDAGQSVMEDEERLTPLQRLVESIVFGLRMNRGVDVGGLEKRFNCPLDDQRREQLLFLEREGWLEYGDGRLRVTPKGRLVLDEISARLV